MIYFYFYFIFHSQTALSVILCHKVTSAEQGGSSLTLPMTATGTENCAAAWGSSLTEELDLITSGWATMNRKKVKFEIL